MIKATEREKPVETRFGLPPHIPGKKNHLVVGMYTVRCKYLSIRLSMLEGRKNGHKISKGEIGNASVYI